MGSLTTFSLSNRLYTFFPTPFWFKIHFAYTILNCKKAVGPLKIWEYREWEGFQTWEWFYLTVHYSAIKYLLEKTKRKTGSVNFERYHICSH